MISKFAKLNIPRPLSNWSSILRSPKSLGLGLLIFILSLSLLFFNQERPVLLAVDGQAIGLVANEEEAQEILNKVKADLSKEYGVKLQGFPNQLTFSPYTGKDKDQILSDKELSQHYQEKLDWQAESWAISINGEKALYLASETEAQAALEQVKARYIPKESGEIKLENIAFVEDVQPVASLASLKELSKVDKAVELLVQGKASQVQHIVKSGESLWNIARANNITVAELVEANPALKDIKNPVLKPGQKINLVKSEPLLTVVSTVTTTREERIPYPIKYESDPTLWRGQQRVKEEGAYGTREVTYRITKANDLETERTTLVEKIITEPVTRVVINGTKLMIASRGDGGGSGPLGWPLRGYITSPYGKRGREFHTGLDISGDTGDPIYAAGEGTVLTAAWVGRYGKMIDIDHGRGLVTRYAHLSSIDVFVGQKVSRGTHIGRVGSTGRSTGSHLHFEVRVNDNHYNPLNYLER